MFKRFTERARRVVILAREEAEKYRHEYLGTEHLLSGILKDASGIAAAALRKMNVDMEELSVEITRHYPESSENPKLGDIPFTARAKKVLEYSVEEARSMGHNYIGTEHIFLGLIKEKDGIASTIMKKFGVNYADAREQILNFFREPSSGAESATKTPALDEFARDLTKLAVLGKLDPVIGRSAEIERVIHILSRRTKNNPILIGEPGVGKTAIVEGLARRIIDKEVPEILYGKTVLCLDIGMLVAGTKYRGQFEARMKGIMKEIRENKQIVLFIDELHTIIGAGSAEGSLDASNMLKPALSRGEIQCIGATTLEEYRKYIEKNGALERRFQPVMVNPPSVPETIDIIRGLKVEYEIHHAAKIADEAIIQAVKLADRYISDRFLPDKAIDVVDEAGSRVRLRKVTFPPHIREKTREIDAVDREKKTAIERQDFEKAVELRNREEELQEELEGLKEEWTAKQDQGKPLVTVDDIAYVVSNMTGIPLSRIAKEESAKLREMEEELKKRVVGQEEAIDVVSRAIRRSRAGLKDRECPIGSFLFIGPTGVGKTELAHMIAEFVFGDRESLIRLDMSEYTEKINTTRLTGAPPGYVGFDEGGQLCEKVRRKPYSVILFDEIEKAHPDIYNILLQIMDDGRLTDNYGRHVSFKNALLILTSNLNTREIEKGTAMGFQKTDAHGLLSDRKRSHEKAKGILMGELKKTFNPEFLNRLNEVIVFKALELKHIEMIVDLQLTELNKKLIEKGLSIHIDEKARKWIAKEGFHPTYGARPLKRNIQKYIEDPLSDEILEGEYKQGGVISIGLKSGKLTFAHKKDTVGTVHH